MKYCSNCGKEIKVDSNCCEECGFDITEKAKAKDRDQGLLVLFYLLSAWTLLESIGIITRGFVYEVIFNLFMGDGATFNSYFRGFFYAIAGIGMITGVLKMLISRKIIGLYILGVSQLVYIVTAVIAVLWWESLEPVGGLGVAVSIWFILPQVIIGILYWKTPIKRKFLTG